MGNLVLFQTVPPHLNNVCHRSSLRRQVHRSRSCHRRSRWIWSWYWICVWISDHRIRQKPISEAAAVLLRHSWFRPVRGHGTVLFDDGLPPPLCFLNDFPIFTNLVYF